MRIPDYAMDAGEFVQLCREYSPEPSQLEVICTRWGEVTGMPEHFTMRWKGTPFNVPMGLIPPRIIWNGVPGESAIRMDGWPWILHKLVDRGAVERRGRVARLLQEVGL